MPSAVPEHATLISWSGEAFRLIPSRFPPVSVYEGLIANDLLDEIVAVENLTNPRLRSLDRIKQMAQGTAMADPRLQNWNLAPFAYGNPDGSTFFDDTRPCLEMSFERQTALAVSVARRETFLEATRQAPIGVETRMLCTPVKGVFWDLRGTGRDLAGLDREERWAIGSRLPEGADGILFRPAERPAGTSVAIVTGNVLERSQQTMHYRYVWDGGRISLIYAFDREGTRIDPEALAADAAILIAA